MAGVKSIDPVTGQEYRLFSVFCEVRRLYSNGESCLHYVVVGKGLFDYFEVRNVYITSFPDPDAAMDLVEEIEASLHAETDETKELPPEKMYEK